MVASTDSTECIVPMYCMYIMYLKLYYRELFCFCFWGVQCSVPRLFWHGTTDGYMYIQRVILEIVFTTAAPTFDILFTCIGCVLNTKIAYTFAEKRLKPFIDLQMLQDAARRRRAC